MQFLEQFWYHHLQGVIQSNTKENLLQKNSASLIIICEDTDQ